MQAFLGHLFLNVTGNYSKWSRGSGREEEKALEYEDICHVQPRPNKNMGVQFAVLNNSVVESVVS